MSSGDAFVVHHWLNSTAAAAAADGDVVPGQSAVNSTRLSSELPLQCSQVLPAPASGLVTEVAQYLPPGQMYLVDCPLKSTANSMRGKAQPDGRPGWVDRNFGPDFTIRRQIIIERRRRPTVSH